MEIAADKDHPTQISVQKLTKTFQKYRDSMPWINQEAQDQGKTPVTFHEIRSLAARIDKQKGLDKATISESMAHSNLAVTDIYLEDGNAVKSATTLNRLGDLDQPAG